MRISYWSSDVYSSDLAAFVVRRPIGRQAKSAGGPIQQPHLQRAFKALDGGGDSGARQSQCVGGQGEAVGIDDAGEDLHGLKTIHGEFRKNQQSPPSRKEPDAY